MRLILIFFLLCSQLVFVQNISGVILDFDTNQPLENVTIFIQKDSSGTVSDASGKFRLSLESSIIKTDSVRFSIIGYHSKKMSTLEFSTGTNIILLTRKLEHLNEVIVNSDQVLNDKIPFKRLASLETGVFDFGSQVVSNYIYVIGGNSSSLENSGKKALFEVSRMPGVDFIQELGRSFSRSSYSDKLQIYDIQNDIWSLSDITFRKRINHNLNTYGNDLFVLGGKSFSNIGRYEYLDDKIEVLKMSTNEIVIDHSNPHQAANFASITYNDNIIILGGSTKMKKNGKKVYSDESHIYNITSGKWFEFPKIKTAKETQATVVGDKIYLVGGSNGSKLNTIESYDFKTAKWKEEGQLFNAMEDPALTSHEHVIYIFYQDKLYTYDTITTVLEEYDISLNLKGPRMHYHKNKLYLIGGYILSEYSLSASPDVYVIDVNEFSKTAPLNSKKFNF